MYLWLFCAYQLPERHLRSISYINNAPSLSIQYTFVSASLDLHNLALILHTFRTYASICAYPHYLYTTPSTVWIAYMSSHLYSIGNDRHLTPSTLYHIQSILSALNPLSIPRIM
ncbi:hypothetical protein AYI68_g7759 [Smittium mucronatum]|uniref:Uncharacterized protein n=1 Tax=Smittium mucronatum TaxID=133383 RepID=A0A1R0GMR8_9FUNG|nr:hypothetical protein AYI68_g7759 [Smittium mucronatum]